MTGRLPYVRECQLLRAASELLRLPQPVIATGLTFLHRYYRACPDAAVDQQIAPACLFLASKVEEAQVRINDLLNAFLYLANPDEPAAVAAIFPGLAAAAPGLRSAAAAAAAPTAALVPTSAGARAAEALRRASSPAAAQTPKQWPPSRKLRLAAAQGGAAASAATAETPAAAAARQPTGYGTDAALIAPTAAPAAGTVVAAEAAAADQQRVQLLVGDKYYAAKDDLIHREQVLLRWLGFQLCVDHPYRYLLNFANALRCGEPVARLSLSLVNDSLLHTDLSARRHPTNVAAGALQLAALLLGVPLDRGTGADGDRPWAELLGVDPVDVETAGQELLDAVCSVEVADV